MQSGQGNQANQQGGQQAGGQGNQNLRAGRINGPIQVDSSSNPTYTFNPNSNQPLMGNIARALDHQASIGLTSLSRYTFSPNQERYVLTYLLHNNRGLYDNIMQGQPGNPDQPQ
jgi:hypothetical protein